MMRCHHGEPALRVAACLSVLIGACGDNRPVRLPSPSGTDDRGEDGAPATSAQRDGAGTQHPDAQPTPSAASMEPLEPHMGGTLYDLDIAEGFEILADAQGVYWTTRGGVHRGSLDGSDPVERWGTCPIGVCPLGSDDTDLYWIYRDVLYKRAKAAAPDSAPQERALRLRHDPSTPVLVDDTYVYLAMPGCAAITRLRKDADDTGEEMYIEPPQDRSGTTLLHRKGSTLYCASWGRLYAIPEWGAEPALLATARYEITGLLPVGAQIFFLDAYRGSGTDGRLSRVPEAGGEVSLVLETDLEAPRGLFLDASHDRILFWDGLLLSYLRLDASDHGWLLLDTRSPTAGSAHDGHLYYLRMPGSAGFTPQVKRVAMDRAPARAFGRVSSDR